jgi:hypothetical protein
MTIKSCHIFLQGHTAPAISCAVATAAGRVSFSRFTARWEASWAGLKNTMTQTALEIL